MVVYLLPVRESTLYFLSYLFNSLFPFGWDLELILAPLPHLSNKKYLLLNIYYLTSSVLCALQRGHLILEIILEMRTYFTDGKTGLERWLRHSLLVGGRNSFQRQNSGCKTCILFITLPISSLPTTAIGSFKAYLWMLAVLFYLFFGLFCICFMSCFVLF